MHAKPLRCVIVDDEAPARAKLRRLLMSVCAAEPTLCVEIVGEADNGLDALDCIKQLQPDLVFLDVQMPELSGTEVAAQLPAPAPQIIFVTAFDAYAVQAFELSATDYLLKPYDAERLQRALQKAWQQRRHTAAPPIQNLLVRDRDITTSVPVEQILWLSAADNYVVLHCVDNVRHVLRQTLAELLQRLDAAGFVRAHRGTGVNLRAIARVEAVSKNEKSNTSETLLVLHGGERLPLSRRCRDHVLTRLAAGTAPPR